MWSTFSKIALQYTVAGVAQLVEQLTCNQPVGGSTPLASSIFYLVLQILESHYSEPYIFVVRHG